MKNLTYALLMSLALTASSSQAIGYAPAAYAGQAAVTLATQACKAIYYRWFANQIDKATRTESLEQETKDEKAKKLVLILSDITLTKNNEQLDALISETQSLLTTKEKMKALSVETTATATIPPTEATNA